MVLITWLLLLRLPQGLQERATKFASMVAAFCERLGWADLEMLVAKFQGRGRGGGGNFRGGDTRG